MGQTGIPASLLGRPECLHCSAGRHPPATLAVGRRIGSRRTETIVLAVWLGSHGADSVFRKKSARERGDSIVQQRRRQAGPLLAGGTAAGSRSVLTCGRSPGQKWRQLNDFLGYSGVVYNLRDRPHHVALYVVACDDVQQGIEQSPASPRNVFTTAGCCASAWQEGGLLYVLVVEGDPSTTSDI